jgi:4-hydroxybenzoate polyprenyltransferase
MSKLVENAHTEGQVERPGALGRRMVRVAVLAVIAAALTGVVAAALNGLWVEAVMFGGVAAMMVWQAWINREPPSVSLSRRLSHRSDTSPHDTV